MKRRTQSFQNSGLNQARRSWFARVAPDHRKNEAGHVRRGGGGGHELAAKYTSEGKIAVTSTITWYGRIRCEPLQRFPTRGGYPGAPVLKITIAGTDRALAAAADGELETVPAFTGTPERLWRIRS